MKEDRISQETNSEKKKLDEIYEDALNRVANAIFSNVKILIEERLSSLEPILSEIETIKFNTVALSTLLHSEGFFTEKEFKECFNEVVKSFGVVDEEGKIKGKVVLNKYNFSS